MIKAISLLILLAAIPLKASAFEDYDVDWPPSNIKGVHMLRITIDNCKTLFHIKDEDFYVASANERALTDALKKAIERASSGCKN